MIELRIVPGLGVPPLEFGMTEAQARAVVEPWNTSVVRPADRSALIVEHAGSGIDVEAGFEKGRLTTVVIHRVEGAPVYLGDLEIFTLDADDILGRLRADSFTVDESEVYGPTAVNSEVSLGFDREGDEFADEEADDGLSRIFVSVLVAPAGYYDPQPR